MLFTKKTEYALLSLVEIARANKILNVDELSKQLNIPKVTLAKILQKLAKVNIVKSFKGVNGGFELSKLPEEISIIEVSKAVEEKAPMVFECSMSISFCSSSLNGKCSIWPTLNKLQYHIDSFLNKLTIKDIM